MVGIGVTLLHIDAQQECMLVGTCVGVDNRYILPDKPVYHMEFSPESGAGHIARIIRDVPFRETTSYCLVVMKLKVKEMKTGDFW
jgi:hypothetical protein